MNLAFVAQGKNIKNAVEPYSQLINTNKASTASAKIGKKNFFDFQI